MCNDLRPTGVCVHSSDQCIHTKAIIIIIIIILLLLLLLFYYFYYYYYYYYYFIIIITIIIIIIIILLLLLCFIYLKYIHDMYAILKSYRPRNKEISRNIYPTTFIRVKHTLSITGEAKNK
jgi:amino acid transporter